MNQEHTDGTALEGSNTVGVIAKGGKSMNKKMVSVILTALVCMVMATPVIAQPTPFVIDGYVSNSNGDPCNDPWVRVTNTNTGASCDAENSSTSNYYRLVLDSDDVSVDELLQFDVSWCGVSNNPQHSVVLDEIHGGGCSENIILAVPAKTVTSCNSTGYPKDAFGPGETVYVKGSWLAPNTDYMVWIQPDPVNESDPLLSSNDPSGITGSDAVTTGADGSFGPKEMWSIPPEPGSPEYYDIVVDNQDGMYFAANDGIDSATTYGIVAPIPELATIALFAVGLVMLLGCMRLGRRD
jgi:hypothetical protein